MSWRVVVVTGSAKVDYKMDYLVVRNMENTTRIHIDEISVLLIESTAVSVTAYALCELVQRKAKVLFCDTTHNPTAELMALHGSHDSCERIRQQIKWSAAAKQTVWTELVRAKIEGQQKILAWQGLPQQQLLRQYLQQLQLNDASNREGHAAKVYFNALFGNDFSRSQENPTNAALNYGYSILLSALNREVTAAGYLTQLGIFHDNTFNPFNLSCDMMEPLRPLVDHMVLQMEFAHFEHAEKMQLVDLLNTRVEWNGKTQVLNFALRGYCKSIFTALQSGKIEDIQWVSYEF